MRGKITEKQIETQILQWLNAQSDIFAFKVNTVGIYDSIKRVYRKNKNPFLIPGTSDILFIFRSRFGACEVKRPGGKPSENQIAFLKKVSSMGGISICTDNLHDLEVYIEKLRQKS